MSLTKARHQAIQITMSCFGYSYMVLVCLLILVYKTIDRLLRWPFIQRWTIRNIVVSGCDTGFGHEIVKRLDRKMCTVFAGCLTAQGETLLRKQCSYKLRTFRLDVSKPESVRQAYKYVKENIPEGKGLWAIVNNAGISGKLGPAEWLTRDDYHEVLNVNLHGVIDMTSTFLPLIKQARGRVVNTASFLGRISLPASAPYCVSKYGVEAFSDSLRRELRLWNCSVHTVEPGTFRTPLTKSDHLINMYQKSWDSISEDLRQQFGEEFFQKTAEMAFQTGLRMFRSARISDVVDAYEHAVLGLFPRARYLVGVDARYFWIPLSRLPEWLSDWVFHMASFTLPKPAALTNSL